MHCTPSGQSTENTNRRRIMNDEVPSQTYLYIYTVTAPFVKAIADVEVYSPRGAQARGPRQEQRTDWS